MKKEKNKLLHEMKKHADNYVEKLNNNSRPGSENESMRKAMRAARELDLEIGIDIIVDLLSSKDISMKVAAATYLSSYHPGHRKAAMRAFEELERGLPQSMRLRGICHMYSVIDKVNRSAMERGSLI